MSKIEEVAKAIALSGNGGTWDDFYNEDQKEFHRKRARAAIEAMREMTAEQERAAHDAAISVTGKTSGEFAADGSVWPLFVRPRVLWVAAIDAALKD